jgi:hypothetical protein
VLMRIKFVAYILLSCLAYITEASDLLRETRFVWAETKSAHELVNGSIWFSVLHDCRANPLSRAVSVSTFSMRAPLPLRLCEVGYSCIFVQDAL